MENAGIPFVIISENCLALPNSSKIDKIIELDKEAVVQDYSSQRVGEFFLAITPGKPDRVWDACAGSGGKSIMFHDHYPHIHLTVSDVRESILKNLKKRFQQALISNYETFLSNLTVSNLQLPTSNLQLPTSNLQLPTSNLSTPHAGFDFIIADVPCSGSGTWGRSPEQLYYYKEEKTSEYVDLQKKIISNIIPHLRPGGHLLYVTCSVFKKENEEVVAFIVQNFPLELRKMEVLKGYDKKADTMFAALLQNPS